MNSKGAALITVLFIVAIVVMISTAFVVRGRQLIEHETWGARSDQMLLALQGAQDWGIAKLEHAPIVNNGILLSQKNAVMPAIKYHGITVHALIQDQQGLFNLNDVLRAPQRMRFIHLLEVVDPRLTQQEAYIITNNVMRKLESETATHQQMTDVTELRTVQGMTAQRYQAIKPYVTVLPAVSIPININWASVPMLQSLATSMSLLQAGSLAACVQQQGPFKHIGVFNVTCVKGLKLSSLQNTTTSSQFFIIKAQGNEGPEQRILRMLVQVTIKNQQANVTAIWRTIT